MVAKKLRKGSISSVPTDPLGGLATNLERATRLLALLAVKGEGQADKISLLSGAGFPNSEIASLLGTTANAVNVALHRARTKS